MLSAHLNTARPWYEETTPVVAAQTVELGGGEEASMLLLPVELQAEAPTASVTPPCPLSMADGYEVEPDKSPEP